MFEGRFVVGEQTLERGGEEPLANLDPSRRQIAKVRRQRWRGWLSGNLGADDLEADEQSLLVINDCGLGGGDLEIMRRAITFILHHHREREWYRRLDGRRVRVVGKDVALQEVFQVKLRIGLHADRGWRKRNTDGGAVQCVAER